ncbi:MAG: hypothetical protein LAO18_24320, partial [Acidobacteriia bacterium]|nr:hypothetical protein [Terriglobia bacterium]
AASLLDAAEPKTKTRIRILYSLHAPKQDRPDWPNKGFDFVPVMRNINAELARRCKGFEFVSSEATGEDQAKAILAADQAAGNIDGYLVYQMNAWNRVVQTIATSGKPVLYADFQYGGSGGFLVYMADFIRKQVPNVGFVASSRIELDYMVTSSHIHFLAYDLKGREVIPRSIQLTARLMELMGVRGMEQLKQACREQVEAAIEQKQLQRQSQWSESLAVGRQAYAEAIRKQLGPRARRRKIIPGETCCHLRESEAAYRGHFEGKKGCLSLENTRSRNLSFTPSTI